MKSRLFTLFSMLIISACAPHIIYTPLNPAGSPKGPADTIDVFQTDQEIPKDVIEVGEIYVGDTGLPTGCDLDTVIAIVKDKAREVGADAAYLAHINTPGFISSCYRVTARLLKYGSGSMTVSVMSRVTSAIPDSEWRRPAPAPAAIVQLTPGDLNPSPNPDRFERAMDAAIGLKGNRMSGSGFLITRDGLALTNHHVIDNQETLEAVLRDGRRLPVRVIRTNASADVALIQVYCATDCFTLNLAKTNPKIGMDVFVIGNPLAFDFSLTRGVVSGLRFNGEVTSVQSDAAINPGNSGGPMLALESGEVIAIVTSKLAGDGTEGIGFGIAISDALRALGVSQEK